MIRLFKITNYLKRGNVENVTQENKYKMYSPRIRTVVTVTSWILSYEFPLGAGGREAEEVQHSVTSVTQLCYG